MEKKKLAILVTGQKSRLELLSKIKNIIEPNSKDFDVSIVFSLSDTSNFTNIHKYQKQDIPKIKNRPKTFTFRDIKNMVGSTNCYMNNILYPDLKLNNYLVSMYNKQKFTKELTLNRGYNHIRQYYTLRDSFNIIKIINPDILIRIREDAVLKLPLELKKIPIKKNSITTPNEFRHGGINDKLAIVSKEAIDIYLNKPFKIFNTSVRQYLGKERIKNPEQFISKVYDYYKLTFLFIDVNMTVAFQKHKNKIKIN